MADLSSLSEEEIVQKIQQLKSRRTPRPGSRLTPTGPSLTLNPELSSDEQKAIAGGEIVGRNARQAIDLIDSGVLGDSPPVGILPKIKKSFNQMRVDIGNPAFVGGELEDLTSNLNRLRSIVPFAKGGKQLTPFEAKQLFRLINLFGKEDRTAVEDLSNFIDEFERLRQLTKEGSLGIENQPIRSSVPRSNKRKIGKFVVEVE